MEVLGTSEKVEYTETEAICFIAELENDIEFDFEILSKERRNGAWGWHVTTLDLYPEEA